MPWLIHRAGALLSAYALASMLARRRRATSNLWRTRDSALTRPGRSSLPNICSRVDTSASGSRRAEQPAMDAEVVCRLRQSDGHSQRQVRTEHQCVADGKECADGLMACVDHDGTRDGVRRDRSGLVGCCAVLCGVVGKLPLDSPFWDRLSGCYSKVNAI